MNPQHHQLDLALFFTAGVSLQVWDRKGMFAREVALYRRLQERGIRVSFVTYGDSRDRAYASRLPGVRILCNRWRLPASAYRRLLPLLHGARLRRATLFKTNQINGAGTALRAARLWRKPLIARCGYLWSAFAERAHGPDGAATRLALAEERRVFTAADRIVVTTPEMAVSISGRMPEVRGRIVVIPNYVDTDLFKPDAAARKRYDLIFIGRLEPQKNVAALLEAVRELRIRLAVVGEGSLAESLRARFGDCGGRVDWLGTMPHQELPGLLQSSKMFILPSHYEGHPKTLIEAMACGLPVIGADAPGIRDVVRHGETGWLCGTDPESIKQAVARLLDDAALRERLSRCAREFAGREYALDALVERELELYRSLCPADREAA